MPNFDLHLADWAAVAQIVLGATALLALLGAMIQIRLTRSANREILTYNYTERFSNPELLPFHQKTDKLFNLNKTTADQQWRLFQSWEYEDQLAALVLPNLFEELAGMYNNGLLHKDITKDFFGYTAANIWKLGWSN